jgi:TPR repeat protein
LKVICNERLITPAQIAEASIKNRQHEGGILQREQAAISLKNMVQQALFFYSTSNNLWEIPICQFSLGNIYKYINTRDGEEDMSNIYMMRAAQNGHRYAQCFAMIHRKDGTSFKDFNLVCLAWYAYSQTNSVLDNALIRLGNHHNHAISSRDAVNTRRQFQSILENIQDNNMSIAEGLCIAGGILEHKEDYKMAMKHYKRSVKQEEFGLGATLVGRLYELGRGVESSYKKAYKWYLLGASRNCPIAYFSLAWMYVNGCYVNTDLDFALNLLERSQKNGLNKESAQEGVDLVNIIKSMSSNQKDIPQEIYDRFKQIAFLHKLMK